MKFHCFLFYFSFLHTSASAGIVSFNKKNKDSWEVNTTKYAEIIVKYSYYAAELNAGSTFLNEDQLYINPVNCMMYVEGESDLEYEISFSMQ